VAFEISEEGEPIIFTCEQPTDYEYSNGLQKRQKVFELDMGVWKRAIETFNITESMIPQRPPAKTGPGEKWYG